MEGPSHGLSAQTTGFGNSPTASLPPSKLPRLHNTRWADLSVLINQQNEVTVHLLVYLYCNVIFFKSFESVSWHFPPSMLIVGLFFYNRRSTSLYQCVRCHIIDCLIAYRGVLIGEALRLDSFELLFNIYGRTLHCRLCPNWIYTPSTALNKNVNEKSTQYILIKKNLTYFYSFFCFLHTWELLIELCEETDLSFRPTYFLFCWTRKKIGLYFWQERIF